MLHRQLDAPGYTLAAIDDVIERGKRDDWLDVAQALRDDPDVRAKVRHIATARSEQSTIHHEFGARGSRIWTHATRRGAAM